MKIRSIATSVVVAMVATATVEAAPNVERLNYSWSLRGALATIARVALPTSGSGTLETRASNKVNSRLTLTTPAKGDYFFFESQMDSDGRRTLTSADGYKFNSRLEEQRTWFDTDRGVAKVQKVSSEDGVETKLRQLSSTTPQDVLTNIYYLRQHAEEVTTPRTMQLFSSGKGYTFKVTPKPVTTMQVGAKTYRVRPFVMTPVDNKRGEVRVWFSDDEARIPVRIEMQQRYGTLKMDVK